MRTGDFAAGDSNMLSSPLFYRLQSSLIIQYINYSSNPFRAKKEKFSPSPIDRIKYLDKLILIRG